MSGIRYRCRGRLPAEALSAIAAAFKAGDPEHAERIDRTSRIYCGHDFTEVIEAAPEDGVERAFVCPDCKARHPYRKGAAAPFRVEIAHTPPPAAPARRWWQLWRPR